MRKYEYLTGEYLGYKQSVIVQDKFDSSPLGKVFTKGLDKDDQKEGLFNRLFNFLENIKDKSEELLNASSTANKVSKTAKRDSDLKYDS